MLISYITHTYLSFTVTQTCHLGRIHLLAGFNKTTNLKQATKLVQKETSNEVQVILLSECFNSPYSTSYFTTYC